jgi:putative flippase GtrA
MYCQPSAKVVSVIKRLIAHEFFRQTLAKFLGVGVLNTIVGYTIYAILIFLNIPYLTALFIATVMGVIFNYFSVGRLVFSFRSGRVTFVKFIVAYALVYAGNALGLKTMIEHLHVSPFVGQALCVPPSVILSWLLMNYWVYKKD